MGLVNLSTKNQARFLRLPLTRRITRGPYAGKLVTLGGGTMGTSKLSIRIHDEGVLATGVGYRDRIIEEFPAGKGLVGVVKSLAEEYGASMVDAYIDDRFKFSSQVRRVTSLLARRGVQAMVNDTVVSCTCSQESGVSDFWFYTHDADLSPGQPGADLMSFFGLYERLAAEAAFPRDWAADQADHFGSRREDRCIPVNVDVRAANGRRVAVTLKPAGRATSVLLEVHGEGLCYNESTVERPAPGNPHLRVSVRALNAGSGEFTEAQVHWDEVQRFLAEHGATLPCAPPRPGASPSDARHLGKLGTRRLVLPAESGSILIGSVSQGLIPLGDRQATLYAADGLTVVRTARMPQDVCTLFDALLELGARREDAAAYFAGCARRELRNVGGVVTDAQRMAFKLCEHLGLDVSPYTAKLAGSAL